MGRDKETSGKGQPLAVLASEDKEEGVPGRTSAVDSQTKGISLRKNFAWTLFGNFFYGGAQWAMVIAIAKLGSPEMVGRFALAFAVTAPVIMAANLNLRGVLATDAVKRYSFSDYLALRLTTITAALFIILLLTIVSGYPAGTTYVIMAVAFAKASESLSDVFYGHMLQHERMQCISISLSLKGAGALLAVAGGVWLSSDILLGCIAMAGAWILLLVVFDIPNAARIVVAVQEDKGDAYRTLRPRWHGAVLRELAWLAFPLGVATLFNSLLTNIPRYFINATLGERELGIFAALTYVVIIGARVVTALGESASPRLARFHAEQDKRSYQDLLLKMVAIGVLCGVSGILLSILVGRQFLTLFYRPEYAENMAAFIWIMVAGTFGYVALFLQYGLTAARQFRPQPYLLAFSALVLTIACWLLIPRYGLTGAAMALTVSSTVQLLGNLFIALRIVKDLSVETSRL